MLAADVLILIGDLNANVGNDNTSPRQVRGKQRRGSRNDNGGGSEFCMEIGLSL